MHSVTPARDRVAHRAAQACSAVVGAEEVAYNASNAAQLFLGCLVASVQGVARSSPTRAGEPQQWGLRCVMRSRVFVSLRAPDGRPVRYPAVHSSSLMLSLVLVEGLAEGNTPIFGTLLFRAGLVGGLVLVFSHERSALTFQKVGCQPMRLSYWGISSSYAWRVGMPPEGSTDQKCRHCNFETQV